jgi:hypothetical protein
MPILNNKRYRLWQIWVLQTSLVEGAMKYQEFFTITLTLATSIVIGSPSQFTYHILPRNRYATSGNLEEFGCSWRAVREAQSCIIPPRLEVKRRKTRRKFCGSPNGCSGSEFFCIERRFPEFESRMPRPSSVIFYHVRSYCMPVRSSNGDSFLRLLLTEKHL